MKIAIGDIHGKNCWKKLIDQDFDECYFVGDYFDNYEETPTVTQVRNFKEICAEARKDSKIHLSIGNHCHSKDTDILTSQGWVNIEEAWRLANSNSLTLAQFDQKTLQVTYDTPSYAHKGFSETLKHVHSRNIDMLVTDNHEVIYKKSKITVKDLALDKTIRESNFPMTGFSDTILNIEDNWIRLLTWVIMDGTIVHDKKYSTKKRVQFHISKERKIITIKQLLSDMNIPFSFRLGKKQENKLQDVYINIYSIYAREICYRLNNQKKIPFDWTLFSNKQFFIFLSTLSDTDGHKRKEMVNSTSIVWSTISENDRDIVSIMCLKNNFIFKFVNKVSHGYANGKIQFSCSINENVLTRDDFVSIKDIQYNDFVYCFTMPRGTLITRRGGKIAFAGNCLQYMKGIEVYEKYSGFQNYGYLDIQEALEENMDLLQPVYQSDDYLISHAGISKTFLKSLHTDNPLDINQKFKENRMCLAFNGDNCYGDDVTQGCLWIRPNSLLKDALDDYKQIVGHTRKDVITTVDNITFIDCLDSKVEAFIF